MGKVEISKNFACIELYIWTPSFAISGIQSKLFIVREKSDQSRKKNHICHISQFASIFSICAHDLFLDENSLLLYTMQLTFKVMQIILSQFNR